MRRLNETEIVLAQDELESIREFIRITLAREWDDHTNRFHDCEEAYEEGLRRMDPGMYDIAKIMWLI